MDWLRQQQKWGVQLALLALVLKTVLAFGHHHFDGSAHHHGLPHTHAVAHHNEANGHDHHGDHAHEHAQDADHAHHHDAPAHEHHHDAAKACSDCLTLAATSVASAAFALEQHQVVALTDCTASYNFVNLVYDRAAFRSRAPPTHSDAA